MEPLWIGIVILVLLIPDSTIRRFRERLARRQAPHMAESYEPVPICGCGDHFAFHDPKTGHCHANQQQECAWDEAGCPIAWKSVQCCCRHYIGPQPLATVYAPELTGDVTAWPEAATPDER